MQSNCCEKSTFRGVIEIFVFFQSSTWPSIPLVVKDSVVGTAMGITTSMQMIGIGVCNLVVGFILGNEKE